MFNMIINGMLWYFGYMITFHTFCNLAKNNGYKWTESETIGYRHYCFCCWIPICLGTLFWAVIVTMFNTYVMMWNLWKHGRPW